MNKTLAATLTLTAALTFGCGKKETFETPDGKLKVDKKGDGVSYEVKTKEGTAKMAASDKGVPVPDTFPKDVPILKGAIPKMAMSQGKTEVLHLHVASTVDAAAKEYQTKLKAEGWEIETTMNMGDASMLQAKKGNRKCAVVVGKDGNEAMVQLSVSQE